MARLYKTVDGEIVAEGDTRAAFLHDPNGDEPPKKKGRKNAPQTKEAKPEGDKGGLSIQAKGKVSL